MCARVCVCRCVHVLQGCSRCLNCSFQSTRLPSVVVHASECISKTLGLSFLHSMMYLYLSICIHAPWQSHAQLSIILSLCEFLLHIIALRSFHSAFYCNGFCHLTSSLIFVLCCIINHSNHFIPLYPHYMHLCVSSVCVFIHQYADGRYWVYSPVLGRRKLNPSSSYNVSHHQSS